MGVILVRLYINHSDVFSLPKNKKKKILDKMGHLHFLLDEMGLDKMGWHCMRVEAVVLVVLLVACVKVQTVSRSSNISITSSSVHCFIRALILSNIEMPSSVI